MTRAADENEILDSLGRIISTHADWLDGRTFQRLCQQVARAYFEEQDLDDVGTFDDLQKSAALLDQAMNLWPKAKR
ncbi:hypothetical protein C0053_05925 [Pseudomonas aeruginosa]|uniref:hypothetical protein n=1 Tax=Pseudomonas aeruginosa TaxID=287 RepID=UPI0002E985BE|nr:hypothetical protein [Pseudomonas aeruginosa]AOX29896.1 hypothetical protein PA1088_05782 [Pseudomonas aeruginosa]AOX36310.1 hypothetical protein PA8281_01533 [Pseudomonas aeruginosa]AOX42906.1 hypothetical protein PA11803_01820 [Pseudomonas aeruginosa]APB60481.1 hypothetical protein PA7790_05199 [Pseudomonas aeruginosa]ARU35937.1 flagellum-specific ATP synthase FliL [Pseudomonas aeruginosa]